MIAVEACLYAIVTAVLSAIVLAFASGGLNPVVACVALSAALIVATATFWTGRHRKLKLRTPNAWESAVIVVYALFSLRAFLWVVFQDGDAIKVLSPNNLGDLSLHLTYIREFANGVPFWPQNPIYAGATLTYPAGIDLFHSLLTLVGADIYRAFVWIGLAGCVCAGMALWRWGGAFVMAGFLFNGGLAGFLFFKTGALTDFQAELAWKSIPLALFVTQRGLLFALPAGLLLLASWRARFFDRPPEDNVSADPSERGVLPWAGELLLYAAMPVFHLHTFLFLSIMLGVWFIIRAPARMQILKLVGAAVAPASALVFLVTGNLHGPKVLGWMPGWMQTDPDFLQSCQDILGTTASLVTFPVFWIVNFGILPLLVILLIIRLIKDPQLVWGRALVFPALGIFVLCCFVKFAPWAWDNTKLMIWCYLAILPVLWRRLLSRWPFWATATVCAILFWSGFVSLLGGLDIPRQRSGSPQEADTTQGYAIASRTELDGLSDGLRGISPTARFIAHPDYNHPLVLLGRKLALGYTGHVWSHGYEFSGPLAREEAILNGATNWHQLAREFGARYLFWGPREREAFPGSTQPWRDQVRLVASGDWGEIFDLETPADLPTPTLSFPSE